MKHKLQKAFENIINDDYELPMYAEYEGPNKLTRNDDIDLLQELIDKESAINKDTESHSEKEILNMCVRLMQCVYGDMLDYMEFMGFDVPRNEDDEGYPMLNYSYSKIVQMLFLWRTTHSGGTSTRMKCVELGVDSSDSVEFKPEDWR